MTFVGALLFAGLVLPSSPASAAMRTVNQCNGVNGGPTGATTGITCTVTVVNTISKNGTTGSTTTVMRQCSLGPCPPGNGTFTTTSTSLVTQVTQCNDSANDAAPPLVTCRVKITNNISAGTSGAQPVTSATVNQCVGTATGGGKKGANGPRVCDPDPATTSGATVTQCNGSVTGGGSTAVCSVPASRISPAIPVRVNQCNGTGNKGGTLLTCSARITTNIVPAGATTPAPGATTPAPGATTPVPGAATPVPGATTPVPGANTPVPGATTPPQVSVVPPGGVDTGSGSTAGLQHVWMLTLGGVLILSAGIGSLYRRQLTDSR